MVPVTLSKEARVSDFMIVVSMLTVFSRIYMTLWNFFRDSASKV